MVRYLAACNIQLSMENENIIGQFFQCAKVSAWPFSHPLSSLVCLCNRQCTIIYRFIELFRLVRGFNCYHLFYLQECSLFLRKSQNKSITLHLVTIMIGSWLPNTCLLLLFTISSQPVGKIAIQLLLLRDVQKPKYFVFDIHLWLLKFKDNHLFVLLNDHKNRFLSLETNCLIKPFDDLLT